MSETTFISLLIVNIIAKYWHVNFDYIIIIRNGENAGWDSIGFVDKAQTSTFTTLQRHECKKSIKCEFVDN